MGGRCRANKSQALSRSKSTTPPRRHRPRQRREASKGSAGARRTDYVRQPAEARGHVREQPLSGPATIANLGRDRLPPNRAANFFRVCPACRCAGGPDHRPPNFARSLQLEAGLRRYFFPPFFPGEFPDGFLNLCSGFCFWWKRWLAFRSLIVGRYLAPKRAWPPIMRGRATRIFPIRTDCLPFSLSTRRAHGPISPASASKDSPG